MNTRAQSSRDAQDAFVVRVMEITERAHEIARLAFVQTRERPIRRQKILQNKFARIARAAACARNAQFRQQREIPQRRGKTRLRQIFCGAPKTEFVLRGKKILDRFGIQDAFARGADGGRVLGAMREVELIPEQNGRVFRFK
ncbi:MAG: hypothetical protein HDKAJFGB_04043 [Anaerolineae bacterium]|nr:hypothetical protein [Anaerolineae bacterium]